MYSAFVGYVDRYPQVDCFFDSHSPDPNTKVINPVLSLEANTTGQFTCTIPPTNYFYDRFEPFNSIIRIVQNGTIIWEGRVIERNTDFYKQLTITCEGILGAMNDTVMPYTVLKNASPMYQFSQILKIHNNQCDDYKRILLGIVDSVDYVEDQTVRFDYESCWDTLSSLVEDYGGYLRLRYTSDGSRYLDWIQKFTNANTQTIEFGKNLMDYSDNYSIEDLCTACMPLGRRINDIIKDRNTEIKEENQTIKTNNRTYGTNTPLKDLINIEDEDSEERLTCASVNDGSAIVYNADAVEQYGIIVKALDLDDVEDPQVLYNTAVKYLQSQQFDKMTLEVSAFDLAFLNTRKDYISPATTDEYLATADNEGLFTSNGRAITVRS